MNESPLSCKHGMEISVHRHNQHAFIFSTQQVIDELTPEKTVSESVGKHKDLIIKPKLYISNILIYLLLSFLSLIYDVILVIYCVKYVSRFCFMYLNSLNKLGTICFLEFKHFPFKRRPLDLNVQLSILIMFWISKSK